MYLEHDERDVKGEELCSVLLEAGKGVRDGDEQQALYRLRGAAEGHDCSSMKETVLNIC